MGPLSNPISFAIRRDLRYIRQGVPSITLTEKSEMSLKQIQVKVRNTLDKTWAESGSWGFNIF